MANSTIPNLVAVTVPALTDLFGVRQSGDTRDKKLTVTQLLSLSGGVPDPLLLSAGAVGAPTYSFSADDDTGVFNVAADQLSLAAGGVEGFRVTEAAAVITIQTFGQVQAPDGTLAAPSISFASETGTGLMYAGNERMDLIASGSLIARVDGDDEQFQVASGSVNEPGLSFITDRNVGIRNAAADQLSMIAGGVEVARFTEAAGANQFAIVASGNSTVPDLTGLADPDTGFRWTGANEVQFIAANVRSWHFLGGSFFADNSDGPILFNQTGSSTVPSILVERSDVDTGLGKGANDAVSLIGGGVEGLRIQEAAGLVEIDTRGSLIVNNNTLLPPIAITAGTDPAADGGDLDLSSGASGVAATGDGGAVNILAGASLATAGDGGAVSIKSGAGITTGAGGDLLLEVGAGGVSGPGKSGNFFVNTLVGLTADGGLHVPIPGLTAIYGLSRTGEGAAGDLELWAGYAAGSTGSAIGGDLLLFGGGQGGGTGVGGNAHLYGGESDNNPGFVEIEGGTATVDGQGGQVKILGGPGFGTNRSGGLVTIDGGLGIGTGSGQRVDITGGVSGSGATGNGGNLHIFGGASAATNGDGGDILLGGGAEAGGGTQGTVDISGGSLLRIVGSVNTNHVSMAHDNTDMNWIGTSTIDWNISGITALNAGSMDADFDAITATSYEGIAAANLMSKASNQIMNADIAMLDTRALRLGTGNDVNILWDGTDLEITGAAGSQVWNFRDGPHIKIFDDSDTDSVQFDHDGTDFNTTFPDGTTTDWNIGIVNLALGARVRTANGAQGAPAHSFTGETNSGLYLQSAGIVGISCAGAGNWLFRSTSFDANIVGGPRMMFEVASATNPTLVPSLLDTDTGIGAAAADQLNLIAGGLSCMSVRETAAARQIGFYTSTPVSQSAAYSRAATIVESRALVASVSATVTNNNNVLAALIADLQSLGLIG